MTQILYKKEGIYMTISEFVSILDYKFILTLCPMDDKAKQILKDFLSEHKE